MKDISFSLLALIVFCCEQCFGMEQAFDNTWIPDYEFRDLLSTRIEESDLDAIKAIIDQKFKDQNTHQYNVNISHAPFFLQMLEIARLKDQQMDRAVNSKIRLKQYKRQGVYEFTRSIAELSMLFLVDLNFCSDDSMFRCITARIIFIVCFLRSLLNLARGVNKILDAKPIFFLHKWQSAAVCKYLKNLCNQYFPKEKVGENIYKQLVM